MSVLPALPERRLPERRLPPAVRPARTVAPNATLMARTDFTDNLAGFRLLLDAPLLPFLPGQYVSVAVIEGAEVVQRPYSIVAVDGTQRRIELFVRRIPGGSLSSRLWSLRAGARVRVGPPRGLFTLDTSDRRPRTFVASGTGLAPFLAMLEALDRDADMVETRLIHATSYADELAYASRLGSLATRGLPLDYRPTISRPGDERNAGWWGAVGRAEQQLESMLERGELVAGKSTVHLCGNPLMIDACRALLATAGFPDGDVHAEQFHAPTAARGS